MQILPHIRAVPAARPFVGERILPESEQAAYIALTVIYRHYRENVLTREQAQLFKEQLTDWAHCPPMERAAQRQIERERLFIPRGCNLLFGHAIPPQNGGSLGRAGAICCSQPNGFSFCPGSTKRRDFARKCRRTLPVSP